MTLGPLLTELRQKGITLEAEGGKLRVKPASRLNPATLELLRAHKAAILEHLSGSQTLPRLPWQLERLLSAAASGVLHCHMRGVPDVKGYTLAWGCSYLTGDRDEALRRLWEVHGAWQAQGVN